MHRHDLNLPDSWFCALFPENTAKTIPFFTEKSAGLTGNKNKISTCGEGIY